MLDNAKRFLQESWLLIVSAFICGLLLAATHAALAPRIEMNRIAKLTNLASGLLPQATAFETVPVEVRGLDGRMVSDSVFQGTVDDQVVGWIFRAVGSGFADRIELVVGVDGPFRTIVGFDVLASNETPGFGDRIQEPSFRDQFRGAPAERLMRVTTGDPTQIDTTIVAITGATVSSTAVVEAINHYLPQIQEQLQQKGLIGNGNQP